MIISQVHIQGFRNFKDATINFSDKNLVFGPNDIGKSNLIYALRLLLDKSIPESVLEPSDSDFYAFEETNTFDITIKFSNIENEPDKDECIWARLGKDINDDNTLWIKYCGYRNESNGKKDYKLFIGNTIENLDEIDYRYYLKFLCLEFVNSNRDLKNYIN